MVRDAYRFLIPLAVLAAVLYFLNLPVLSAAAVLLAAFVCYFFRNPVRRIPDGRNLVVSPADGKVVRIDRIGDWEGGTGGYAVGIFLNVFNVHVNRSPIEGRLEHFEYKRGRFKAAYDDAASTVNEQNVLTIRGQDIIVVVKQIAGLIARRVVCWKRPGEALGRGELFGLIRFGSRVDVLLPEHVTLRVRVGDRVEGGASILGEYE